MTVLTERATATRTTAAPVVRELALVEARKMLRHPLSIVDLAQADVLVTLEDRWVDVLDPATTPAEVGSWFGLTTPEQVELEYFQAPCR